MSQRIIINGKWRRQTNITGVQRYATEVLEAFDRAQLSYVLRCPGGHDKLSRNCWEQFTLPRLVGEDDLLFCPANMAPLWLRRKTRLVLTIHCLRFHFHPENYSAGFVRWYRFAIPRIASRADAVLTVSHATADEIETVYPATRGKVHAVYPGVGSAFRVDGARGDDAIGSAPYWIYLGGIAPAKNLSTLLEALANAHDPHRIALAGISADQVRRLPHPELHGRLVPLGHVNDTSRLASMIRGSVGLLAPSRYESFDFPVVEAMACGKPVIASDIRAHREIAADGAMLIPPDRSDLWAEALDTLGGSTTHRDEFARRGLARAGQFQWDATASTIWTILQRTLLR